MLRLTLPATFLDDRAERGLDCGTELGRKGNGQVCIHISEAGLADLKSDADHYATAFGPDDSCPKKIVESAKRTLAAIAKQGH